MKACAVNLTHSHKQVRCEHVSVSTSGLMSQDEMKSLRASAAAERNYTQSHIKNSEACPPSLAEHHVYCLLWTPLNICQPLRVTDDINCSRALALLCGCFLITYTKYKVNGPAFV